MSFNRMLDDVFADDNIMSILDNCAGPDDDFYRSCGGNDKMFDYDEKDFEDF